MNWISIKDQKPDIGQLVLVCKEGGDWVDLANLERVSVTVDGESLDWLDGDSPYESFYKDVTHWMPLPKPKEDTR